MGQPIRAAFVSTNSITQGEQVGVLWGWLLAQGIKIHFAHRTFAWNNEARGKAAVHCVIIGFGLGDVTEKTLFEYEDIKGEAHAVKAANINPYLVDAPDVLPSRSTLPLQRGIPVMNYGSMPIDDGWLILEASEKTELLQSTPEAAPLLRRFVGGEEFLNNRERWCLWLVDADPALIRRLSTVANRLTENRRYREASNRPQTRALAKTPGLFGEIRQPESRYLLIPKVSSENRTFIPIGFMPPEFIASGTTLIVPDASLFHFGILHSTMHMAWMRAVCGRLESRYQYSAGIVYNTFPWPDLPSPALPGTLSPPAGRGDGRADTPDESTASGTLSSLVGRGDGRADAPDESAASGTLSSLVGRGDGRADAPDESAASGTLSSLVGRGDGRADAPDESAASGTLSPLVGRGQGEGKIRTIETAAQAVLDARAAHPGASLADLYDPLTMPPDLVKAHQALDKAVDAAYGYKGATTDAARVAFLFGLYQQLTHLPPRPRRQAQKIGGRNPLIPLGAQAPAASNPPMQ